MAKASQPGEVFEDADVEDGEDEVLLDEDRDDTPQAIVKLMYTSKHNIAVQRLHPQLSKVLHVTYNYIDIGLFTSDAFPDHTPHAREVYCLHALRWAAKSLKCQPVYNCLKSDRDWTAQMTALVCFISAFFCVISLIYC